MTPDLFAQVTALQQAHRSIRRFRDEPLPPGLLERLIRAGQSAASSLFIQAYSVVRVTRPEARRALAEAAGHQAWVEQAPEFLVLCADLRRVDRACRDHGQGALEGWTEHGIAAIVDLALMAQNLVLAAEAAGLGCVYIGGIRNGPDAVADQLALPELVLPVFGLCLGWPAEDPEAKPRMPLDLILHEDTYRDPEPGAIAAYDARMAEYYAARGNNARRADWSSNTAKGIQSKRRKHLLAFMQERGFFRR
jgi:nitroreductase